MSVSYQQLLHNVGLRMSALAGVQLTGVNTTYDTATLTSANFKSIDWPFNSFRDAILMAEQQFAEVAALVVDEEGVGSHVWRSSLASVTTALANNAVIPAADAGGSKIIGAYGEVADGTDGHLLTKRPLELVRRLSQETWRVYPLYYYNIVGRRLVHTRTTAVINVCVYNRSTQLTAWNAAGNMLLPDTAEPGITALAVALMTRDAAFAEQSAHYQQIATAALALVAGGGVPSQLPPLETK